MRRHLRGSQERYRILLREQRTCMMSLTEVRPTYTTTMLEESGES